MNSSDARQPPRSLRFRDGHAIGYEPGQGVRSNEPWDVGLEPFDDPWGEPDPPIPREHYNLRGKLVGWILRQIKRRWPSVFWNEVAHARADSPPVEKL